MGIEESVTQTQFVDRIYPCFCLTKKKAEGAYRQFRIGYVDEFGKRVCKLSLKNIDVLEFYSEDLGIDSCDGKWMRVFSRRGKWLRWQTLGSPVRIIRAIPELEIFGWFGIKP